MASELLSFTHNRHFHILWGIMESRVKFLGHPVHPVLIVFPMGLLVTAVIFDAIALTRGASYLFNAAYWMIAAGLVGGVLSAISGLIDWLAIPSPTRAKNIGLWHGLGNLVVLILFALSWWLRRASPDNPSKISLALSFAAVVISLVTAWLGGELVDRLGVGVDTPANLNAPNSLSRRPVKRAEDKPRLKRVA
ncbi:MAG: rane protein [Candidatus Sulfotelmatobacter sp.]|nr:rane protein [Candidatus Sulfotelmatobacter sp.]